MSDEHVRMQVRGAGAGGPAVDLARGTTVLRHPDLHPTTSRHPDYFQTASRLQSEGADLEERRLATNLMQAEKVGSAILPHKTRACVSRADTERRGRGFHGFSVGFFWLDGRCRV